MGNRAGAKNDGRAKRTLEFFRRQDDTHQATQRPRRPISVYGSSDVGNVRENNEDQFLIAELKRTLLIRQCSLPENDDRAIESGDDGLMVMVADGMGGVEGGEVASSVVMDAIAEQALKMVPWLGHEQLDDPETEKLLARSLQAAVTYAQGRIFDVAERKGLNKEVGTTLTWGFIMWPMLYLVHIGDSRAYLSRNGELFRLTRDHNLADRMIRKGVLTEEQARNSRFGSILTNVITADGREVHAELHQLPLEPNDVILLCTDGLYDEMTDSEIGALLRLVLDPAMVAPAVEQLIESAKTNGGRDNVTALLAKV